MSEEIKTNEVRVYRCETWDQFTAEVRKTRLMPKQDTKDKSYHFGAGTIFRGHSKKNYLLSSTIERNCMIEGEVTSDGMSINLPNYRFFNGLDWYDNHCETILNNFKKYSHGLPEVDSSLSDEQMWSIGRHYGLFSPYLDWSASPFVAAFFALENSYKLIEHLGRGNVPNLENEHIYIWGLRLWEKLEEVETFEIVQMFGNQSSRPRAQQSWFTKLRSKDHIDILSYLKSRKIAHYLECYVLNLNMANTAIYDLQLMNINYLTLFPDAIGAARHSNVDIDMARIADLFAILGDKQ